MGVTSRPGCEELMILKEPHFAVRYIGPNFVLKSSRYAVRRLATAFPKSVETSEIRTATRECSDDSSSKPAQLAFCSRAHCFPAARSSRSAKGFSIQLCA